MKEQDAAHSFEEGRKLPPDNETVEDGGGCYVAGSREDAELLAEKNAFHLAKALDLVDECYHYLRANPPDKVKMTYSKWQNLVEETDYMREFNARAEHVRYNEDSELTRLRSELQQKDRDYLSFYRWVASNGWEEHSSGRYFYKLAFQSQWPPSENNCATGEDLIRRWRDSKKQS